MNITMEPTVITRSYGTVKVAVTFDQSVSGSADVFDDVITVAEALAAAYVLDQTKTLRKVSPFALPEETTGSLQRSFTFQPVGSDAAWSIQVEYTVNHDNSVPVPVAKLTTILDNALGVAQHTLVDKLLAPVRKVVVDAVKARELEDALKDAPKQVRDLINTLVDTDNGSQHGGSDPFTRFEDRTRVVR